MANEAELWRAFESVLHAPARGSAWFSHNLDSGLFPAAGYGLGWLIRRRLYDGAGDRQTMLSRILSASEPEEFFGLISAYEAGFLYERIRTSVG